MVYIVLVKTATELLDLYEITPNRANFLYCDHALHYGDVGVNTIVINFFFGDQATGSSGEACCDIIRTLG